MWGVAAWLVFGAFIVWSVYGVGSAGFNAMEAASRHSRAPLVAEDQFHDETTDIDQTRRDYLTGAIEQHAQMGNAAAQAPGAASPGVGDELVLTASNAWTVGQYVVEKVEGAIGSESAPSGQQAPSPDQPFSDIPSDFPGSVSPDAWVVWQAEVGWQPLEITTKEQFDLPVEGWSYPGGGTTATPIKKTPVAGPFSTKDEAMRWLDGQLGEPFYMGGVYAGMYAAEFNGETHNIEHIGFDPRTFP